MVSNAGVIRSGQVRDQTAEDVRAVLSVNLLAAFALTKAALPHLEKTKGNIVYVRIFRSM